MNKVYNIFKDAEKTGGVFLQSQQPKEVFGKRDLAEQLQSLND